MNKKHLIWFNSQIEIDESELEGWSLLQNPPPEEFWSKSLDLYESSAVVFLFADDRERGMIVPAARKMLEVTPDVRLLRVALGAAITPDVLEKASLIPEALLDIGEEDLAALSDAESVVALHPAQDCLDSIIYYGAKIHGKDYLISSQKELIPLLECPSRGIALVEPGLSKSGFSHSRVLDYFAGLEDETPNRLHSDIVSYLKSHIYFGAVETYDLLALWVMGTYLFRLFRYYPYLHLNAEKGSGKTLLMELLEPIAFNGILMSQPSASTVLKLIAQDSATLFIDEAEALGSGKSNSGQLKNILKTGFARSGMYYSGEKSYRTFSPKCFAGINTLDDVLADRAITIRLLRKTEAEHAQLYRETPLMRRQQASLRDRLYLFGLACGPAIAADYDRETEQYDRLPHLSNRAFDVWVPLFKIVNAFTEGEEQMRIFQSLDVLSQVDAQKRKARDREENETSLALEMLTNALKLPGVEPAETKEGIQYYDTDIIYDALRRLDLLPKKMELKGLSRFLKRTLDIESVPRSAKTKAKRRYAIDQKELESYQKRYGESEEEESTTGNVPG